VNAEAAPKRQQIRTGGRLIVLLLGALSLAIALSGIAYAYWSARGTGTATVSTGTLNPPTNVTGSSAVASAASISWTAPTGTPGATGYDVVRTNTGNGTTANVCGTPAVPVTTTSCTDTAVAAGTYTYRVTAIYRSWTAQSAASNAVTILVATKLAFTTQPSTAVTAGSAFSVQPIVTVQDANGNTAGSDTSVVTLALTNPAGATLTCTGGNAVTAAGGVATFAGCRIDKSGTYTLTATDGSLTSAVSTAVTISAGAAAQLSFVQQPSNTAATSAISPAITVDVLDQFGNPTSSTASVNLAIGTNPSAGVLSGTQAQPAVSGVATFSNLSIDKAGTGYTLTATSASLPSLTSNFFNISVGAAAKLVFAQQPSGATVGVAFTTQPKVAVEDAGGNIVTTDTSTVNLTKTLGSGSGTLSGCSGVATNGTTTFSGCKLDAVGTNYMLTATDNPLAPATSARFDVTVGAPAKLVFTQQPSSSTGGAAFATQPKVAVEDASGNVVITNASAVSLAITGASGATLNCTNNPLNAASGIATFGGCAIDKVGTYTLTATDGNLASALSTGITINVGAAAKLAFTTSPTDSAASSNFTTQPVVTVQDAGSNTVVATTSITLSITSGTGTSGAALSCTANPKAASAGVDTFAGCKINLSGNGYTLTATGGGFSTTSTAFNVYGPLLPTALTITNGTGTAGKADTGDVITITWNQPIQLSSVCSAWTSPTASIGGVTVTMARGNGNSTNDLSVTLGTGCSGGVSVGTLTTATSAYETGNTAHAFTNSTLSWNAATNQLIITLGSGTAAPNIVGNSTYVYNPDTAIARAGVPGLTATGTASTGNVKNF
jgi:hypothetical protein